jgi:hypothetical protein
MIRAPIVIGAAVVVGRRVWVTLAVFVEVEALLLLPSVVAGGQEQAQE